VTGAEGLPEKIVEAVRARAVAEPRGKIFSDEVGESPLQLQPKLLSYLQEKSFSRIGGEEQLTSNARILAATNRDLKAMVEDGRFREDLYFRLNVLPIEVPPLRDRKDDIRGLFDHFITRLAEVEGRSRSLNIEPGVYEFLLGRDWPGNVCELDPRIPGPLVPWESF